VTEHSGHGNSLLALKHGGILWRPLYALAPIMVCGLAQAAQIENGLGLDVEWDNSVRFSMADDFNSQGWSRAGQCNLEADGPAKLWAAACAQQYGLTTQRVDWWTELNIGTQDFGLHATADSWYDSEIEKKTSDNLPITLAPNLAAEKFIAIHSGQSGDGAVDLRDLFFYGKIMLADDEPVSVRLGRHALLWGESLFFTGNGIAGALAPVDGYLYQTVASYQSSTAFLPVDQVSLSWQPMNGVAVDFYDQFDWRRSIVDPYNAYASAADILGADNLRLIGLNPPGRGPTLFARTIDQTPGSSDQLGAALKFQRGDFDYGLYALSFNAKNPVLYLHAPAASGSIGSYTLEYPKDIGLTGISLSGPLGAATIGGELSGRWNMPLVTGGVLVPSGVRGDNNDHPLYPVGDTLHAQVSWNYATPPLPGIPGGASWSAEIAANDRLDVTANDAALGPGRTRLAAALRTVFEPQFFQVLPRLDLTLPVGFGYNFLGLSSVDSTMNRGTGDVSLGVSAVFDQVWTAQFNVTHYFGHGKNALVPGDSSAAGPSLDQFDFIAFSIQRTF
jgi:hypothetical protein